MAARKKDISVETMRCIAAIFVIGLHTIYAGTLDGNFMPFREYTKLFMESAVGIFWFISGFFMFSENGSYKKMMKRCWKKILLPMIVVIMVTWLFYDFINGGHGFWASFDKTPEDWIQLYNTFMVWSYTDIPHVNIVWYLMIYAFILLCWPVLNAFVIRYLKDNNKNQIIFLAITFGLFVWNMLSRNYLFNFNLHISTALVPSAICIIWGYIIYQHKDMFLNKKLRGLAAIGIFFACTFIRLWLSSTQFYTDTTLRITFGWQWPTGLIESACVCIACFAFAPKDPDKITGRVIAWIGSLTLSIYLVHSLIIAFIVGRLHHPVHQFMNPGGQLMLSSTSLNDAVYYVLWIGTVFLCSLLLAIIIRLVANTGKKIWAAITGKNKKNGHGGGGAVQLEPHAQEQIAAIQEGSGANASKKRERSGTSQAVPVVKVQK